ncbi:MAG: peptidoglycan DD-metalloendopeptidase family protein [Actinomycetota bacterium]|nr:peptidoglycan DD-metalloendopeptidase family protein [Actinomycetota bacterium]
MPIPPRILLVTALLAAAPVALASTARGESRQEILQGRITALRGEIARAKHQEGVLSTEVDAATSEIEALENDIGALSAKVEELESQLARFRARLAALEARYRQQTRYLNGLRLDHARAQRILETRLVELYESGETDALAVLLQVESLSSLLDQIDFMNEIGRNDQRIVDELRRLTAAMREARERTRALRDEVAQATAVIEEKTEEARAARAELVARELALEAARAAKRELLAATREERHEDEENLDELQAASAALAARIRAASSAANVSSSGSSGSSASSGGASSGSTDATPSSRGLIWPVSGTVTSGFGMRWGRMHEGIDIAAPAGTTVHAAASGRVIVAGWTGGYGNLIVIDHGGGLATAYGHLSALWVGGGSVSQGQGIGAVGCTGSCTGPHLHFEVRVNGTPVDPLAYL